MTVSSGCSIKPAIPVHHQLEADTEINSSVLLFAEAQAFLFLLEFIFYFEVKVKGSFVVLQNPGLYIWIFIVI